jgi:hypothetical protein
MRRNLYALRHCLRWAMSRMYFSVVGIFKDWPFRWRLAARIYDVRRLKKQIAASGGDPA